MAARKTQEESEQPAKVYQLDAIESQIRAVSDKMDTGLSRLNTSVETLLIKSESQVTPQQLSDNILAEKLAREQQIKEEVDKIHLTYGPLKENIKWLTRTVVSQAIIIVGQLLVLFLMNK